MILVVLAYVGLNPLVSGASDLPVLKAVFPKLHFPKGPKHRIIAKSA